MPKLFTIGYEHHTPETLVTALRDAGVERLVDVRELPLSRRRGFSKTALAETLQEAEIAYVHKRALGNPKPYRDLYRSGRRREGERRYRAHLVTGSHTALVELSEGLTDATTCLLCVETAHEACHRAVIVEALAQRFDDLQVVHLQ